MVTDPTAGARVFLREECEALATRVLGMMTGSDAQVEIENTAVARTAFARGDTHIAAQDELVTLSLNLITPNGRSSSVATNRLDDAGLRTLVDEARSAAESQRSATPPRLLGKQQYPDGLPIYFDSTVAATGADAQAGIFNSAAAAAEAAGLVGSGDLRLELSARAAYNTKGLAAYVRGSYGEFSLTARTKDGTGSGWSWSGFEDWGRVKTDEVIARAVDLGKRSANPVAVEPGRYTVILEPAAVATLLAPLLFPGFFNAEVAEQGGGWFAKAPRPTTKLGLQMIDARLDLSSSPWDPDRPASTVRVWPFPDWIAIPGPVKWFQKGMLTNLEYDLDYAEKKNHVPVIDPHGLRLETAGPTTSLEEMIASTKRGIWVNRLSSPSVIYALIEGTTRDGTFLIENGKITKAIKNLRFIDSPFYALNRIEAIGEAVRASRDVVAPRLKVRDFEFTGITDAV